jgi:putative FmdB family regulatory protein
MAIYEYKCDDCGREFEVFQDMSDKKTPACKSCGGEKVRKQISQTNFVLKGTGWYATDYKKSAASPPNTEPKKPTCGSSDAPACKGCPAAAATD